MKSSAYELSQENIPNCTLICPLKYVVCRLKGIEYGKLHELQRKVVEHTVSFGDTCQVWPIL